MKLAAALVALCTAAAPVLAQMPLGSVPGSKGYWEIRPGLGGFPARPTSRFSRGRGRSTSSASRRRISIRRSSRCKPAGGPAFFNAPGFEIVDVPEMNSVFILNIAGPHSWRVIHMDGRPHPRRRPAADVTSGHSIGRWDGDTLVVDTVGFNEKQWLAGSFPTTDQLHLTERISRPAAGDAVLRSHDRRSRRLHEAVDGSLDDHREVRVLVDPGRRDLRIHLPGRWTMRKVGRRLKAAPTND